jgi:hypothetical protein
MGIETEVSVKLSCVSANRLPLTTFFYIFAGRKKVLPKKNNGSNFCARGVKIVV